MSELKSIRLGKAAADYNVSIYTITEHLRKMGFSIANNPSTKLSIEMIKELEEQFDKDRVLREKVDAKPLSIKQFESIYGIKLLSHRYKTEGENVIFLDLRNLGLKQLKPLDVLPHLTELYLSQNSIQDIRALSSLSNLRVLDLGLNLIEDISPLETLSQLEQLYLQDNRIENLSSLKHLKALHSLDLGRNNIQDIHPLGFIQDLRILYLDANLIDDIRPLSNLGYLQKLSLGSNPIQDISSLKTSLGLRELYLFNNQIKDIEHLSRFHSLVNLELSLNEIQDLTPLSDLADLSFLHLDGNQITNITPLSSLKKLMVLILSRNLIETTNLTPLFKLNSLKEVRLDENPCMQDIPVDEYSAGWSAVKNYLMANKTDEVDFKEIKILLLGNPNVGKSTLLNYLKTNESTSEDATHGIKYEGLTTLIPDAHIHIWDFGGQEYFHATHQLFFSGGAVHILLWSAFEKQRDEFNPEINHKLEYWFRCISQLSGKGDNYIDCIVAENKINEYDYIPSTVNQSFYKEQFPQINFYYTAINLQPQKRLEGFKELLKDRIESTENFKTKRPRHYLNYLNLIRKSNENYLLISSLATAVNLIEGWDQIATAITTMKVFHNMGFVLYFPDILPDIVFIKPKNLLDFLYNSILTTEVYSKAGCISEDELKTKIDGNPLNLTFEDLIKLLHHYKLIFQTQEKGRFFIPQYLNSEAPAWVELFKRHHFGFANVRIESDSFLMNQALLEIFGNYGLNIKSGSNDGYLFWKDGIVIEKQEQVLLVKFDRSNQRFELFGDSEGKNLILQEEVINFVLSLYTKTTKELDEIEKVKSGKENWDNPFFDIMLSADGINYAKWKDLKDAKHSYFNSNGMDFYVKDFKRYLPKNSKMKLKKIFISYSKKDLALVNTFQDHLAALRKDGLVETWYCTELKAGQKWDAEIQRNFDESDIACFMISHNFMKTTYIHEHEIKNAFDRYKRDDSFKIVPIYLDFCDWSTDENNLKVFTALPYALKPVCDFQNQNMAWYTIEQGLKTIIMNDLKSEIDETTFKDKLPNDVRAIYEKIANENV